MCGAFRFFSFGYIASSDSPVPATCHPVERVISVSLVTLVFGDFGVSFTATVAGRYTRRGAPRLSVRGEPLLVPTRGPLYLDAADKVSR